jgi:hypothetical protein
MVVTAALCVTDGPVFHHQEFKKDYLSAYQLFEAAALKVGHFLAHFWLANMYDQGLGVQPSCTLAAAVGATSSN